MTKNPRLLIADDIPGHIKFAVRTARQLGFLKENIVTAKNGSDALAKYNAAIEQGNPFSVVFSDRDMGESPNHDDGDILAAEIDQLKKVPFVLISATPPETCPRGIGLICEKGKVALETIKNYLESYQDDRPTSQSEVGAETTY